VKQVPIPLLPQLYNLDQNCKVFVLVAMLEHHFCFYYDVTFDVDI